MAVRVLCTGDIHIGRRSSKVAGIRSCADAWSRIVDLSIEERVDLLAVSGDIVDGASKSYESLGPLEGGLRRLDDAGIATVAVAGNHDFDVLPRLAGALGAGRFHLLGKGGTWERHTLRRDGAPLLHIDGWSFPREHVRENPMLGYLEHPADDVPVLGLLHADLGSPRSNYGPVMADDLLARRVDLWLLGHIHAPQRTLHPSGATVMYPGSPVAMDPGEGGAHGVWIAEFEPGQPVTIRSIAHSPVRYLAAAVDVASVTDEEGFKAGIVQALRDAGHRAHGESDGRSLAVVSCRFHLTGASAAHHSIALWSERARAEMGSFPVGSLTVEIDEITSDVRPPIDLVERAALNDPVGETARLLLALDSPDPAPFYADLVRHTTDDLVRIHELSGYASLAAREQQTESAPPGEREAIVLLKSQGWRMLSELVAMKAEA